MTTFSENVRNMMGWCPQKDNEIFPEQTGGLMHASSLNLNPARKSSGSIDQMDVPLYFFDWRFVTISISLFISFFIASLTDDLYRTPLSYFGTILVMVTFLVLLFLSYHNRVSINSEELIIKTPPLSSIKIPKSKIENIKNIENIIYKQKHNWVNIVFILSILFIAILQFLSLYRLIALPIALEDAVMSATRAIFILSIFILIFYMHSYRSHYPRAIQIESGNEKITLCPKNEFEFNMLMEELKR